MPQALAALNAPPAQLKSMVEKTGLSLDDYKMSEKLELLEAIKDRLQYVLTHGEKMQLSLPEINRFLKAEGMEEGEDGKSAVTLLWNLRELKIALLGAYVGPGGHPAPKPEVPQWLALIPNKDVEDRLGLDDNASPPSYVKDDEVQAPDTASNPPSKAPASAEPAAATTPETRPEVDAAATADQSVHASSADASPPEGQKRKHEDEEAETPSTSKQRLDQSSTAPASVEHTSGPNSDSSATATSELSSDLKRLLEEAGCANTSDALLPLEDSVAGVIREVKRIMGCKDIGEILVGSGVEEKRSNFVRIAKLLHPDKLNLLGADAALGRRADVALRRAIAANKEL